MVVDFYFHQYFGKKGLEFIDNYESPYYCSDPNVTEKTVGNEYVYDSNNIRINTRTDMMQYAATAIKAIDAPIQLEKIIFVIHHSEFNHKCPNETLVFYEDGCVVKTTERTRDFMDRIFKHAGPSYSKMREIAKQVNGHSGHSCPYVHGKIAFMPISGPMKKDVSWISLSHLLEYREHPNDNGYTRLEFFSRNFLDLQVRAKTFEKRMAPAVQLYAAQHRRLMDATHQFDVDIVRRDTRSTKTVLHKQMLEMPKKPLLNELALAEKLVRVTYKEWKNDNPQLKDCPYLEELDKLFFT